MGVGLAVLTETKLVDDRHPKTASGYTIMCSKAVSGHQGGVAIMWKENDPKFEVESVLFNNGPNIVTFQVTTGDERFYVIGIYVPPDCSKGVDDLRGAWEACPQGCKPIVLGDLNINFGYPRDEREEIIVDLLDEINIALRYDYLDINEVVRFLREEKPPMTHVCLTGRNAKEELIEIADLVTEMTLVKHPFRSGIKAQVGVEF